jgi:hypothetical protein
MIRMKREAGKSRRCPRNGKVWLAHAGPVVAIATVAIGNGKARQRKTKPGDRPVRYRLPTAGVRCISRGGDLANSRRADRPVPVSSILCGAQAILFAHLVAVAAFARLVSCCRSVCFMFKARQPCGCWHWPVPPRPIACPCSRAMKWCHGHPSGPVGGQDLVGCVGDHP